MGQDPEAIRREIEDTRDDMGNTLDALGYKADVKSRAKENVQDKKDAVKGKVQNVMGRADEATPSTGRASLLLYGARDVPPPFEPDWRCR